MNEVSHRGRSLDRFEQSLKRLDPPAWMQRRLNSDSTENSSISQATPTITNDLSSRLSSRPRYNDHKRRYVKTTDSLLFLCTYCTKWSKEFCNFGPIFQASKVIFNGWPYRYFPYTPVQSETFQSTMIQSGLFSPSYSVPEFLSPGFFSPKSHIFSVQVI